LALALALLAAAEARVTAKAAALGRSSARSFLREHCATPHLAALLAAAGVATEAAALALLALAAKAGIAAAAVARVAAALIVVAHVRSELVGEGEMDGCGYGRRRRRWALCMTHGPSWERTYLGAIDPALPVPVNDTCAITTIAG
jgi:hypothetical protein